MLGDLHYGDLSEDKEFVNNCEEIKENLRDVQKVLDQLVPLKAHYDKMSMPAQIELDLFLAFALNSLQYMNLRIQGIDPMTHPVKDELQRIKATMQRWQEVQDRDKRPKLNIEAAKRFVRSGLYDPNLVTAEPQNKKIKFEDSED